MSQTASFSIENAKLIGRENFAAGIGQVSDSWQIYFQWHEGEEAVKRLNAMHGLGLVPQRSGNGLVPRELDKTTTLDLEYLSYGFQLRVEKRTMQETPGLMELIGKALGRSIAATYRSIGHEVMAGSFSGTDVMGKPLISTTHATEDGDVRPNHVESAFDRDAVAAAEVLAMKWVDYKKIPSDFSATGFNLAVSPEMKASAIEVLKSGVSSSEMQTNAVLDLADFSVEDVFDSSGDFLLVSKTDSPYHAWDRSPATIDVRTDQNDPQVVLYNVDFAFGADRGPTPDGVIGGKA